MLTDARIAAPAEKEKISFRGAFWISCIVATLLFWAIAAFIIWRLM